MGYLAGDEDDDSYIEEIKRLFSEMSDERIKKVAIEQMKALVLMSD